MDARIKSIQIQTIDACNSRCIMCPHKSIEHTGKTIDDDLFVHIVDQIAEQVSVGLIAETVSVNLFFQNEPLIDPKLFQWARYVREKLPRSYLICFTNGLLLPKLKQQIIDSDFNELYFSLYGYDVQSFNRLTELKINKDKFEEMLAAMDEIKCSGRLKAVTSSSWRNVEGRMVLFDYSSRAGFYSRKILHHQTWGCKRGRANHWLHFHADGEMILCCMDWLKETVFGNIKQQSLGEIVTSEPYQELLLQVSGDVASKRDFICKRCEWAMVGPKLAHSGNVNSEQNSIIKRRSETVTESKLVNSNTCNSEQNLIPKRFRVEMAGSGLAVSKCEKTLIFTSASQKCDQLFIEWLVSLRTLGNYHGEVLVLDYGITNETRTLATKLGAQLYRQKTTDRREEGIVNYRFVDVLPIIEQRYRQYKIAHFDADIWFTGDIAELFNKLDEVPGCLYSVEHCIKLPNAFRGPQDPQTLKWNMVKVEEVIRRSKGHINGGFIAAQYHPFINKLTKMRNAYADGWQIDQWGVDQYLTNVLFNFDLDHADGYRWNCGFKDILKKDGDFYHTKHTGMTLQNGHWVFDKMIREEKVVGLHLNRNEYKYKERFSKYHSELFRRTISYAV